MQKRILNTFVTCSVTGQINCQAFHTMTAHLFNKNYILICVLSFSVTFKLRASDSFYPKQRKNLCNTSFLWMGVDNIEAIRSLDTTYKMQFVELIGFFNSPGHWSLMTSLIILFSRWLKLSGTILGLEPRPTGCDAIPRQFCQCCEQRKKGLRDDMKHLTF